MFSCIDLSCAGFGYEDQHESQECPFPPSRSSPKSVAIAIDHEEVTAGTRSFQSDKKMREKAAAGSCYICFEDNPNIATLCCGHAVHLNCLSKWLEMHATCPQCRATIPKHQCCGNADRDVTISDMSGISIDLNTSISRQPADIMPTIRGYSNSHRWVERDGHFVGLARSPNTQQRAFMDDLSFDDLSIDSIDSIPDSANLRMLDSFRDEESR